MINERLDHHTYSILYANSCVVRNNHIPVVVTATENGNPFEFWLLRGQVFYTEEGEEIIPEGYLDNKEFFLLQSMLEGEDEEGNVKPRTLPMERSEIFDLVMQMREQQT